MRCFENGRALTPERAASHCVLNFRSDDAGRGIKPGTHASQRLRATYPLGRRFPLPLDSHGIEQQFYSDIALCQVCFCFGQNDAKLIGEKRPVNGIVYSFSVLFCLPLSCDGTREAGTVDDIPIGIIAVVAH
jgi:hypothetical protein